MINENNIDGFDNYDQRIANLLLSITIKILHLKRKRNINLKLK